MKDNQDHFDVLRKIQKKTESTQRELAEELGFRRYGRSQLRRIYKIYRKDY